MFGFGILPSERFFQICEYRNITSLNKFALFANYD